jgi:hypothetical protein
MYMIDGKLAGRQYIIERVAVYTIGANNDAQQGWIGPEMKQRTEHSKIGLPIAVAGTYNAQAFVAANRVDECSPVALLHGL